jgi:hypothetical protein
MDYLQLPNDNRTGPNCGVTAIAAATGQPFNRVWSLCAAGAMTFTRRKRFRGGTVHMQRVQVLEELGADFDQLQFPKMNLQKFGDYFADEGVTYMVTTTSHVQLLHRRDDQIWILDQQGIKPISEYWGRKKFISKPVIRINAKPQPAAVKQQPKQQRTGPAPTTLFPALFREAAPHTAAATQLNLF